MERRRKNRTGKKYLDYRLPFAITTISKCDCRLSHSKGGRGRMGGEGKDPFSTSCLEGKKMTNARLKRMKEGFIIFLFKLDIVFSQCLTAMVCIKIMLRSV